MKNCRLFLFLFTAPLIFAGVTPAAPGFTTEDGQLLDANGEPFVMRGVNYPHAWFPEHTSTALKHIAATGANSVRVVLANGRQWDRNTPGEVRWIIEQLKDLEMTAIVEVHDATGYGQKPEAVHPATAVDYWLELEDVLKGEEAYVIINIANEPLGNGFVPEKWLELHAEAIGRLREAGFTHTLMVDAANWGQDHEGIMLEHAPALAAADPQGDVVFSVHMYDVYDTAEKVQAYFEAFLPHGLPLVVGEFAADHGPGKEVAVDAILAGAAEHDIGYLAWSWSGNADPLGSLDLVHDFDPDRLTPWGARVIDGPNGIDETARRASVFTASGDPASEGESAACCGSGAACCG